MASNQACSMEIASWFLSPNFDMNSQKYIIEQYTANLNFLISFDPTHDFIDGGLAGRVYKQALAPGQNRPTSHIHSFI